jgi:alpha-beta hydrolase superfamily lysophospholipase
MLRTMLALFLGLVSFATIASCPRPWVCENLHLPVPYTTSIGSVEITAAKIRAGYLAHEGSFKGNVLYFEGLGDSMLNHDPLFKKISQAGFRVIAFDYMGQGGSSGRMNKTRIEYIPWIGNRVWNKFAIETEKFPVKTIIGWSTGGLAAYALASEKKVDKVILIAPGIAPRKIVGEGLFHYPPNQITLESLTSDVYFESSSNPHREDIVPNSPLKVPHFTANLLFNAEIYKTKIISTNVQGLILLSGDQDTYVNAERTRKIIQTNAPHFKIKSYDGALHEIDNERREIREKAHHDILKFLNKSS